MYELRVEDHFDAAHQLKGYQGACERLHGHTFRVQVFLRGDKLKKEGFLLDFKEIKTVLKGVLEEFDHHNLNELKYFKEQNPTSENVARTLFELLSIKLPIFKVCVFESEGTSASYFVL